MSGGIFEEVKLSVSMAQVAEMCGFHPDRTGRILCPFHHEKTPSLKLYDKSFYCYGCQAGGDIIKFVQLFHDCAPLEAAQKIAAYFGVDDGFDSPFRMQMRRADMMRKQTKIEQERAERASMDAFVHSVNREPLPIDEASAALYAQRLGQRDYYEYKLREEA